MKEDANKNKQSEKKETPAEPVSIGVVIIISAVVLGLGFYYWTQIREGQSVRSPFLPDEVGRLDTGEWMPRERENALEELSRRRDSRVQAEVDPIQRDATNVPLFGE